MNRRNFLKASMLSGGGLLISSSLYASEKNDSNENSKKVGSVLEIYPNNSVVVYVYKQEMGQGAATGIAQIAAEELGAAWKDVRIRFADYNKEVDGYLDQWGRFDTGGSYSIETEWTTTREAAAAARLMLISAAAARWSCGIEECQTENGFVIHKQGSRRASFGELSIVASELPVPKVDKFKSASDYEILGKPLKSVKSSKVVTGELTFSIDAEVDGMVHAVFVRPPVLGGKVVSFDSSKAKKVKGISKIFRVEPLERNEFFDQGIRGGIAIVGDSTWACIKASKLLEVKWDHGSNGSRSDTDIARELEAREETPAEIIFQAGNGQAGIKNSGRKIKRTYKSPYLGHGLMEPLNAIAECKKGKSLEVWAGTQSPQHSSYNLARALNIPQENIVIHPYHMGGGYGRKYFCDFILEAAIISQEMNKPVKLTWTREDEIQIGAYHPMRHDVYQCGLDADGNIESFEISAVSTHMWSGGEMPIVYGHENLHINSQHYDSKFVTYGSWRAVVPHHDTFAREIFVDEIANEVGADPLQYRIAQLKRPTPGAYIKSRNENLVEMMPQLKRLHIKVLEELALLSKWDKPRGKNIGLGVGIAAHHDRSYCAHVAEVEMQGKSFVLRKVYTVADCGLIVNPNLFEAQVQSSINWALTPVLKGGVDIKNGAVVQSNFHDMPVIKMHESPEMEIKLVNFEDRPPAGVGEFAVTPLAPAISNAIFAASGMRKRFLRMA